jgi:hypothetical protein
VSSGRTTSSRTRTQAAAHPTGRREGRQAAAGARDGRLRDGHDGREDAPRGHVVDRRGGERHRADARAVQAALVEDAGEHRERGDAHGRAEEERERQEADARRRERRVEQRGEGGAEQEGCDDARVAHRDGRVGPPAQQREVEAQADDEHVQEHAELAQGGQRHHAVGREERGEGAWGHRSKHRRPERQPGDHLADHRRLPQRAHQCPRHAGGEQDDDELSEEKAEVEHTGRRRSTAPDAPGERRRPERPGGPVRTASAKGTPRAAATSVASVATSVATSFGPEGRRRSLAPPGRAR